MNDFLFTAEGRIYLLEEYEVKERSTYDIAKERGVYANLINRALRHHGIFRRDRHKAQQAALKSGRHPHPKKSRQSLPEGIVSGTAISPNPA